MRLAALLLLVLALLSTAAMATVLTVSGVGAAAAGEASLPNPGSITNVYYTFSGGQITAVTVTVSWAAGLPAGDYKIRVELRDASSVLASGETTVTNPSGVQAYTFSISPPLDFAGIQSYTTFRAYIVKVA
jgi:hypothetical protein